MSVRVIVTSTGAFPEAFALTTTFDFSSPVGLTWSCTSGLKELMVLEAVLSGLGVAEAGKEINGVARAHSVGEMVSRTIFGKISPKTFFSLRPAVKSSS